ncbi:MAG TPA: SDR family oxidoreductase [Propionibacteriaceae bacterium]|nr:SDR family oxidoreductase [Propionibacteriaceae bacterium]
MVDLPRTTRSHPRGLSMFDLSGKVALVTGSSRGIGLGLAAGLAAAGAHVVVHGRDHDRAAEVRDRLAATGGSSSAAAFDLTDAAAVTRGIAALTEESGCPDILVNNAGMQLRAPLADFTLDQWNLLIATNLTSAFLCAQAVAPGMSERGTGKIINVGSIQSRLARPSITPYSTTKGGIVMLTRGLCADLAPKGIQCNALAPGYFDTDLTSALVADESFSTWVAGRTPAGRWGQIDDLVGTCVFLASGASDFVNGQIIHVDGGMSAVV